MAKTAQDVMQLIREQGIKMVDFKMVDINGQYRHVTIPAQNFTEATMTDGIGFDASNYGYAVVEKSDMVFIPDPATAQIDPFCEVSTLSMTGNAMIIDYPHNRPLDQYPRNIVLAAEQYMRDTGIADTMLILPEFEFYLFDDVAWKVAPNEIGMSLDAEQASSSRGRATTTLPSRSTAPTSAAARCACAWRRLASPSNITTPRSAARASSRSSRSSAR